MVSVGQKVFSEKDIAECTGLSVEEISNLSLK